VSVFISTTLTEDGMILSLLGRLLKAGAKFAWTCCGVIVIWTFAEAALDELLRLWQDAPQEQAQSLPVLSKEAEALYLQIRDITDRQQQIDVLKRYVLTLPADPDQGY
jgi:hypothetical protein